MYPSHEFTRAGGKCCYKRVANGKNRIEKFETLNHQKSKYQEKKGSEKQKKKEKGGKVRQKQGRTNRMEFYKTHNFRLIYDDHTAATINFFNQRSTRRKEQLN